MTDISGSPPGSATQRLVVPFAVVAVLVGAGYNVVSQLTALEVQTAALQQRVERLEQHAVAENVAGRLARIEARLELLISQSRPPGAPMSLPPQP